MVPAQGAAFALAEGPAHATSAMFFRLARQPAKPRPTKPTTIIAQVEGSGAVNDAEPTVMAENPISSVLPEKSTDSAVPEKVKPIPTQGQ